MAEYTNILNDYFLKEGEAQKLSAGHVLFKQDDKITWMHWLAEGHARLVRQSVEGHEITMQSLTLGLLGEASLYQTVYHCSGLIERKSSIIRVSRKQFEQDLSFLTELHNAFTRYLANNLKEARAISEIKSLKRITERLDAWIALYGAESLRKGELTAIATQIGVSREALYRELSKRR